MNINKHKTIIVVLVWYELACLAVLSGNSVLPKHWRHGGRSSFNVVVGGASYMYMYL